ncbi:flagellar basal body P-ring formation chaperone FlgA [Burkholderia dolosa]|uniref:flagellar basal body P-ring formation chaperone FlgA n=1 Tax=Burkholderia dolosa TaxID=152500 RepID=UPI0015919616|nr:flagellar basal body P-ring formation chaperone FlgA [Burkholderia dolosa]MBY4750805.1 flagellar basal body P-ring formation protein FlgA [Burkholderia dolosa]
MTRSALRGETGRRERAGRALALVAALWIGTPAAHADDGMIVIPGRGETAESALAHANAASGGQFAGNAGAVVGAARDVQNASGTAGVVRDMPNASGAAAAAAGSGSGFAMQAAGTTAAANVGRPTARYTAAPRANDYTRNGDGTMRAADPAGVVTVAAGASAPAMPAANVVRQPTATPAARGAAARAAAVAPAPRTSAATADATASTASTATTAAPQPPGQQDPDTIRRTALAFLQQQIAGLPGKTIATVSPAFPRGLAACTTLEPFLPTGARLWGRTTVGVRCAGARPWTVYLRAKVAVQATYYVAARQIAPGEPLSAADLVARDGDLTTLPVAVITDPAQAVGATALARISAGLPLRQDMLKSAASVSAGQTVRVVAAGAGFTISAEGSALANAAPGQSVRVRMSAGQIVTAIVKDAGTVEIPL